MGVGWYLILDAKVWSKMMIVTPPHTVSIGGGGVITQSLNTVLGKFHRPTMSIYPHPSTLTWHLPPMRVYPPKERKKALLFHQPEPIFPLWIWKQRTDIPGPQDPQIASGEMISKSGRRIDESLRGNYCNVFCINYVLSTSSHGLVELKGVVCEDHDTSPDGSISRFSPREIKTETTVRHTITPPSLSTIPLGKTITSKIVQKP